MELDNNDKFYITEDTIVRFMLSRNKVISQEELKEIQDFAQFSYSKNLALYHLSFKARTEKEVREYLKKYDIDENIVSQVIANLKEDNWINDGQYAYAIINANQLSGDKGPYVLTQKLAQKGISKSTIEEILNDFDFSEVAQRVANKLLKKYEGKLPARALQDKIIQNLTNKGFSTLMLKVPLTSWIVKLTKIRLRNSSSRNLISNMLSMPESMKDTNLNSV